MAHKGCSYLSIPLHIYQGFTLFCCLGINCCHNDPGIQSTSHTRYVYTRIFIVYLEHIMYNHGGPITAGCYFKKPLKNMFILV